jgi:hypothetical protein
MGRITYVCATCSEHFTRRYSATRHNITIHSNRGQIVPLLEYLAGRHSCRYHASDPSWYRRHNRKRIHNFGHITTAATDSMFRTGALQRQQQGQQHHQSLDEQERYQHQAFSPSIPSAATHDALPNPTDQMLHSQPINTTDDEETTTILSHETRLKIAELKRLVYKYPQYHHNPAAVINCIVHFCNNGDNTLLDGKLEQLRMLDSAMGYPRM